MRIRPAIVAAAIAIVATGCGGSDVSADQRIDRCLKKQPDSTKADCAAWEKDGELEDDGSHAGHGG